MSVMTKRKYVAKEVLEDFSLPEDNEIIVRHRASRGNNLHEVEQADGQRYLVSMPPKFRKSIWLKRGSYLLVTPILEGKKVQAEITRVLYAAQIANIQAEGLWPLDFYGRVNSLEDHHCASRSQEGTMSKKSLRLRRREMLLRR